MFHRLGMVWVILAAALPISARAAWGPLGAGFCGNCQLPFASCGCAQPVCGGCRMAPGQCQCGSAPTYQAVQSTVLQPVVRTELRQQAQVVNVPVTVSRQVTVDEGSFQTVWVPRPVARTVTETVVQRQVRVQQVPVQVVQQVPVTQTRLVAIPQPHAHTASCNLGMETASVLPHAVVLGPAAPSAAQLPAASVARNQEAPAVVAEQPSTGQNWQKVPRREATRAEPIQQQSFETVVAAPETPRQSARAPSAVAAWRAQSHLR